MCIRDRYLSPLPEFCYQIAHYKDAVVPANYHIQAEGGKYYSVPYELSLIHIWQGDISGLRRH